MFIIITMNFTSLSSKSNTYLLITISIVGSSCILLFNLATLYTRNSLITFPWVIWNVARLRKNDKENYNLCFLPAGNIDSPT